MVTWTDVIGDIKNTDFFRDILIKVARERTQYSIYPEKKDVFNAFRLTEFSNLKVVILGQDPYHGVGQANGLAFSVAPEINIPPSLQNIYKELQTDIPDFRIPEHGCLTSWAQQGVFLLNTVLTVRAGMPQSHQHLGWQQFTDEVIMAINHNKEHVVFLLWGASAQKKSVLIDQRKHLILKASHPSPLSAYRGFFGCQHFSKTNHFLIEHGLEAIDWKI
ncbi:MAG: uracil-DNA glycosylase [Neisseriaceae bacterium]|nr:MAG: uracil-DNA glycosylase [Neisseriaceae bacterium]